MSKSEDCQASGNGVFPVINQGTTYMEYAVGDWNEVEDTKMSEIPVEAWEDQGEDPPQFWRRPPLLCHRKGQKSLISLRGREPKVLSRRHPGT